MNLIDLDCPPAAPSPPGRPRQIVRAAALLLAGAVLGGAATYCWTARRPADARDREVAVFVFAEAGGMPRDAGSSVVQDGRVESITLARRVTIVNAGPVPVNVRNLAADRPGVSLRGVEQQRWVQPGATVRADAEVRVECARGLPLGRLPLVLSVQTADERARSARARDAFDVTPWTEPVEMACAHTM